MKGDQVFHLDLAIFDPVGYERGSGCRNEAQNRVVAFELVDEFYRFGPEFIRDEWGVLYVFRLDPFLKAAFAATSGR